MVWLKMAWVSNYCLTSTQQIFSYIMVFGLTWSRLEPTIYCTRGKHATHYTINAVGLKRLRPGILNIFIISCVKVICWALHIFAMLHTRTVISWSPGRNCNKNAKFCPWTVINSILINLLLLLFITLPVKFPWA